MKLKSLGGAAVLLCLILTIVVAFVLFDKNETPPEVTLPSSPGSSDSIHGSDELGLGSYTAADVTPETVQSVIATLSRADSYSRVITVETFWDGGSRAMRLDCYARDGDSHLVATGDGSIRHILILGDLLYIWYGNTPRHYEGSAVGGRPELIDEYSSICTYEELLSLAPEQISGAGYVSYNGEDCIFAQYTAGVFDYTTKIYVSISTGLLMGAERYDGDTLIYRMNSDTPVIETPEDEWFTAPS
ncbi:MAG: hypothetical protein AB7D36_02805 [Oscillospiraceae bacterium]